MYWSATNPDHSDLQRQACAKRVAAQAQDSLISRSNSQPAGVIRTHARGQTADPSVDMGM